MRDQRGHGSSAFRLGIALKQRGLEAEATGRLPRGTLDPAYVLIHRGDVGEALPFLRAAVTSGDDDIVPRVALTFGILFVRSGQLQEARDVFEPTIRSKHPDTAPMAEAELAALAWRSSG